MDPLEHDPLLHRLRAADPAAGLDDALPDRPAVRAAIGHRTRARRFRVAVPAPVLAAGVAAVVLIPSGTPAVAEIVDRAAAATEAPPDAIVAIRSRIEGRFWSAEDGHSGLTEDETAWVRSAPDGRPRAIRTISRLTTTEDPAPREQESTTTYASPGEIDGAVSRTYDPESGRTTTERGTAQLPRLVFDAHRLLEAARRSGTGARLDGEATVGGRRTYRLVVAERPGGARTPGIADRTELHVDRDTYEAVELRITTRGRTVPAGVPFTHELVQRVVDVDELADTAQNRAVLELRGPTTVGGRPSAGG